MKKTSAVCWCGLGLNRAAKAVIEIMGADDAQHCGNQKYQVKLVPDLLGQQKYHAGNEQHNRQPAAMVMPEAVAQRIQPNQEGQPNHAVLKKIVFQETNGRQKS